MILERFYFKATNFHYFLPVSKGKLSNTASLLLLRYFSITKDKFISYIFTDI